MGFFKSMDRVRGFMAPAQPAPDPAQSAPQQPPPAQDGWGGGIARSVLGGIREKFAGQPQLQIPSQAPAPAQPQAGGWRGAVGSALRGVGQEMGNRFGQSAGGPPAWGRRRVQAPGLAQVRENSASQYPSSQPRPPQAQGPMERLRRI